MTDREKKQKRYLRSVKRRLNLPPEVKQRVMSDFAGALEARREAGVPEAAIYAEFGSAKKAASDLNGQMKEYAYRKSPWRFLFAIGAGLAAGWILLSRVLMYAGMLLETLHIRGNGASIGIIGGADGPTAVFVTGVQTGGTDWDVVVMGVILVICILGYFRLRKCRKT